MLSEAQLADWGWRIPFAIGALASLAALQLRRRLVETEAFAGIDRSRQPTAAPPVGAPPRCHAGHRLGGRRQPRLLYVHDVHAEVPRQHVDWSKPDASLTSAGTLVIYMLIQPAFGALSDRIGRRPQLIAFGALGLLGTVPLLTVLARTASHGIAFALILTALTTLSAYTAISGVVKAELFPTHIRALGVGLPYALSVSLFGGTAEYAALWFKGAGHEAGFFWYVAAMCGGSLVAALLLPRRAELIHT